MTAESLTSALDRIHAEVLCAAFTAALWISMSNGASIILRV